MATSYPGTIDVFTNPSGTQTVDVVDHALEHTNENGAVIAVENVLGTTSGTSIAMNFAAGQFAVRQTGGGATGTLVQTEVGGTFNTTTINNPTIGTPAITGGTSTSAVINAATMGSPNVTGGTTTNGVVNNLSGTINNSTTALAIGTPVLTGGSVNSVSLGTSTITGGTMQSVTIGTPATNNQTYSAATTNLTPLNSTTYVNLDNTNLRGTLSLTGNSKVRIMFCGAFTSTSGTPTITLRIVRNPDIPVTLYETPIQINPSDWRNENMMVVDTGAGANGTWAVQYKVNQGTAAMGAGAYSASFSLEEIKAG